MDTVVIRKMNKADVSQIMEIEQVSFGKHHWSENSFNVEATNPLGNYFSAIDGDGRLLGYCGFWLIQDEAHITTIAIRQEFRGMGLGELLLQEMIKCSYRLEAKWMTLEVRAGNTSAQNLYFKYKFKNLGVRKKYYQDNNEDAVIMWTENIWDKDFKENFKNNVEILQKKCSYKVESSILCEL